MDKEEIMTEQEKERMRRDQERYDELLREQDKFTRLKKLANRAKDKRRFLKEETRLCEARHEILKHYAVSRGILSLRFGANGYCI